MKKMIITLLCLTIGTAAARAQTNVTTEAGKFAFKEETHDYGEVPEGPAAEYDFVFKNKGDRPIIITEARGSCGCTIPEWPKEPVLPGKKGIIHVKYNTQGRPGPISKEIYISSNAEQQNMTLHIRGTVVATGKEDSKTHVAVGKR